MFARLPLLVEPQLETTCGVVLRHDLLRSISLVGPLSNTRFTRKPEAPRLVGPGVPERKLRSLQKQWGKRVAWVWGFAFILSFVVDAALAPFNREASRALGG